MKKRINLYNPATNKQTFDAKSLSGGLSIVGLSVGVFLLVGIALFGYSSSQQATLDELKSEKQQLEASVAAEQARFTGLSAHPEILAEQKKINADLVALQDLKNLLQYVQPDRQTLFSKYIYALSQSSLPNSWLTNFTFNTVDSRFMFSGGAEAAEAVPVMLESMVQTSAFKGMTVADLAITAEDSNVIFKATAKLGNNE